MRFAMKWWKELFAYDGKVIEVLNKLGELILVNIVFVVCCLPIITIGSSLTSFYYAVIKSIRRERGNPLGEFFSSMKRTLRKGCIVTLEALLWIALLYLGREYARAVGSTRMELLYLALMVISAGVLMYIFPVLSRFKMKLSAMWKLAFVMCIRFLPVTAVLLIGSAAVAWLVIFHLPMACVFIVPGCWCYIVTFLMERVLLAYMPKPEEGDESDENAWYFEHTDKEGKRAKKERKEVRHESL